MARPGLGTRCVQAGYSPKNGEPRQIPIIQSTTFKYESSKEAIRQGYFCVDKGSVTVNGVSLTVCRPTSDTFQVCIIPFTWEHTNFHTFEIGTQVNIEFDILGKYIARMNQLL